MGQIRHEADIAASADDVWKVVSDFGDLSYFPGLEEAEIRVDGETRYVPFGGDEIVERLVERDDDARRFAYSIITAPLPIESHQATFTVEATGDGSRVVCVVDVTPDELVDGVSPLYAGAVAGLKVRFEG